MPQLRRRPWRTAAGVLLLALVVGMAPWIGSRVGALNRVHSAAASEAAPVGIVLGAAVRPDGEPSDFLQARIDLAAQLWQEKKITAILVSGNRELHYDEPAAMRNALINKGIPAEVIVEDPAGYDTYDTCVRARHVYGIDQAIMISQHYHVPRAVTTCRLVGLDATGAGDSSVRVSTRTWWWGELREVAASWKMVVDVVIRRQPTLGRPDPAVQEIVDGARS